MGNKSLPNIILIVLDSVRQDHLSCYGHENQTTPHIDELAAAGSRYDRAYSGSCWTIPSHASLFTGLLPSQHRADWDTKELDAEHETLAGYLTEAGYATGCFTCNGFISDKTGLDRGFETSVDISGLRGGSKGAARLVRGLHRRLRMATARDRGARAATRQALGWIRDVRDSPFFLFINYMDCHLPYKLRGPDRLLFVEDEGRAQARRIPLDPFGAMAGRVQYSLQDVAYIRALYDGALHYLDRQIGEIVACLREQGTLDDSILVVTSDHGESFGEDGLFDHQYGLYERLIRVPLIVRWPSSYGVQGQSSSLVQHTDLFATVADLLTGHGVAAPRHEVQGQSLLGADADRRVAMVEYRIPVLDAFERRYPELDTSPFDVPLRAAIDERYKLVQRGNGSEVLYDLLTDREESRNVIRDHGARASALRASLLDYLGPWPPERSVWRDSDKLTALRERLKELGYL